VTLEKIRGFLDSGRIADRHRHRHLLGQPGTEARRGSREALWKHADWDGRAVVWDFRSAHFDVNTSDIRELAVFVLEHQPVAPPSRVAFVTARDVDFGMTRMFEVFREDPATEFRVFRDYHEAVAWARAPEPSTT
jgi:hypothetical protein